MLLAEKQQIRNSLMERLRDRSDLNAIRDGINNGMDLKKADRLLNIERTKQTDVVEGGRQIRADNMEYRIEAEQIRLAAQMTKEERERPGYIDEVLGVRARLFQSSIEPRNGD